MSQAGFEKERRWLQTLTSLQEGSSSLFALVGFEKHEADYLTELARERFKTVGLDLPSQIEPMNEKTLEKLKCFQYSLFEKAPIGLYEMTSLSAKDQQVWLNTIIQSGLSALILASSGFDKCWKDKFPSSSVLDVSDEKPWHKSERISIWFRAFLKHKGLEISPALASEVVQAYALDRRSLRLQAQLWADEKGYQGVIQPQDLQLDPAYTVWKLLDDLWQMKTGPALQKISSLLKEEPSGISLSALLRQQWSAIGNLFEDASNTSNRRQQQLESVAKRLGMNRWKEGIRKIHSAQLDLRSSKDPKATLERLFIELTQLQR